MGVLITGLLSGGFALGGIWLKSHIDNRNQSKLSLLEKATQVYYLLEKLRSSTFGREALFSVCLKEPDVQKRLSLCTQFFDSSPDNTLETLSELEFIILANFNEFNDKFRTIREHKIESWCNLNKIFSNIANMEKEAQENLDAYLKSKQEKDLLIHGEVYNLQNSLLTKYINIHNQQINLWICIKQAWAWISNFIRWDDSPRT